MTDKILQCCFTGHRPKSLPWGYDENHEDCLKLKEMIEAEIMKLIERQVYYYYCGMAEGVDLYCAEIVLKLKKQYDQLFLECVIPFEEQAAHWKISEREKYFSIIERSDKETLLQYDYTSNCYIKRNSFMVSHSDIVFGVSKGGQRSGTVSTLRNAITSGKEVIVINPLNFEITNM